MIKKGELQIYTDGACSGNPGPGGWCYVLVYEVNNYKVCSGYEKNTTNNRMELTAIINGLKYISDEELHKSNHIIIFSDSKYVINGLTQWLPNWKARNWKTSDSKEVKNQDLWIILDKLFVELTPNLQWTKGHSNDRFNNLADLNARKEIIK